MIENIREDGLVGDFMYPENGITLPVVVFLGGSGGGLGYEMDLRSLALNGYAVFSLAYFKEVGLPDKLENIPLEYFEKAFVWLGTKAQVDNSKLVLLGVSRGAELALLLGSTYPQVKGVIAYSPSCFVFPNATEVKEDTLIASWTLSGRPVPFVSIKRFEEQDEKAVNYTAYIDPILRRDSLEEFMIKVERINGPILLFSGARDSVWPATRMSERIEARLKEHDFKQNFTNTVFRDGGHDLFMLKDCVPIFSSIAFRKIKLGIRGHQYEFILGGTTLGVVESKVKSRKIAIRFLDSFKATN